VFKQLSFIFILGISSSALCQASLQKLASYEQFKKLAGAPLNTNIGNSESVKIVYDVADKKLYFINSKTYKFHYEFCTRVLGDPNDVERFNEYNYSAQTKRDYLLGNINFNSGAGLYFLDLSVFDQIPAESIALLIKEVQANSYFKDSLKLFVNTERLIGLEKEFTTAGVKLLKPAELYKNQTFQTVSNGKCVGRIRFEPNLDSLSSPLKPEDILITHGTPKYFPNVAGIITDEFQTPLSHLSILGKNRKIPIAVDKKLLLDSNFQKLAGTWINLQVTNTGIIYRASDPKYKPTDTKPALELNVDTLVQNLVPVAEFSKAGPSAIGNKAYNFGLLQTLQTSGNFKTPEDAYAIPFYFYLRLAEKPEIKVLIDQLKSYDKLSDDSLKSVLKSLQKEIKKSKVDPKLVAEIQAALSKSDFTTFRFRSSTNAEDAKSFSGAGLYQSKTVDLFDCDKSIEKAILNVWASLWSYEAFQERRFFNLSDEKLAMGILIHRSFPAEEANGVVITKNVYRSQYSGISVNVQFGDVSVVEPPQNVICDQLTIVYEVGASGFDETIEYISNSSLGNGTPVLSNEELMQLKNAVEIVKQTFWKKGGYSRGGFYDDFGLDIEFKFQGPKRELYLKQVRYYND
jgi:hypothetical protein